MQKLLIQRKIKSILPYWRIYLVRFLHRMMTKSTQAEKCLHVDQVSISTGSETSARFSRSIHYLHNRPSDRTHQQRKEINFRFPNFCQLFKLSGNRKVWEYSEILYQKLDARIDTSPQRSRCHRKIVLLKNGGLGNFVIGCTHCTVLKLIHIFTSALCRKLFSSVLVTWN